MKLKFYLFVAFMFFLSGIIVNAQTISFSGRDANTQESVALDSVQIVDLNLNKDTTITGTGVFNLNNWTGVEDDYVLSGSIGLTMEESNLQNGMNKFSVSINSEANLIINIYNLMGYRVASYSGKFSAGKHHFTFGIGNLSDGLYVITVGNGSVTKSMKFTVSGSNSGPICEINYTGSETVFTSKKPKNILASGDSYNFTAYAKGYNYAELNNQTPKGGENYTFDMVPKEPSVLDEGALIPITLFHVKDSDGSKARKGVDVTLIFESGGICYLYMASDTDAASYRGSYEFDNGKLRMIFNYTDFNVDETFPLDTANDLLSLPFNIFSSKQGSSTWLKKRLPVETMLPALFNAIALGDDTPTVDDATQRCRQQAEDVSNVDPNNSNIQSVIQDGEDIQINYKKGVSVWVILYMFRQVAEPRTLNANSFANDPRTHLNVISPNIPDFDPPEKTALFIAPWDKTAFPNWITDASGHLTIDYGNMTATFGADDSIPKLVKILGDYGYSSRVIADSQATIQNIIKELLPGNGRSNSPGYVYFSTHGNWHGELQTGTYYYTNDDFNKIYNAINTEYPDLWNYNGGTKDAPKVFRITQHGYGFRPGINLKKIQIMPDFWNWLDEKGADFSKSFVYISACLTDSTPELRNAVKAKAYFAYRIAVPANFAGAVSLYALQSLVRPTRSTEEVYYNIIRIANTGGMIFAEDTTFRGKVPADLKPVADWFRAYGYDGSNVIAYQDGGWYNSDNLDQGAEWYLLWAARWGQSAENGWNALADCWNCCWVNGDEGGLGHVGCNNMSPGRCPTAEETSYAGYLLKGQMTISSTTGIKKIPRFTLFDGK